MLYDTFYKLVVQSMRFSVVYAIVLSALIAVVLYVSSLVLDLGRHSTLPRDLVHILACMYTDNALCITHETVEVRQLPHQDSFSLCALVVGVRVVLLARSVLSCNGTILCPGVKKYTLTGAVIHVNWTAHGLVFRICPLS